MTVFYLDPINGNDANDGLTFAARWKTIANGATFARVAAGDEIRFIESPPKQSIGNCTWTNGSRVIQVATPVNKVIDDCESGWVASTNISIIYGTSGVNGTCKVGNSDLRMTVAAAFTTGKAAYKTLPATLDLSAYQQISMWVQGYSSVGNLHYQIKLCSDTTGDVPLATLEFDTFITYGNVSNFTYFPAVSNNGSALPSGVNSVAIYIVDDLGASSRELRFDNIVAAKAPTDPLCVTHKHLIRQNSISEPWVYMIQGITDTTIEIGGADTPSGVARPYRGPTVTVDTFVNGTTDWLASWGNVPTNGDDGNPFKVTFGWNSSDMTTRSGETWLDGNFRTPEMCGSFGVGNWVIDGVGITRMTSDPFDAYGNPGCVVNCIGMISCATFLNGKIEEFNCTQIWGTSGSANTIDCNSFGKYKIGRIHGDKGLASNPLTNGFIVLKDMIPELRTVEIGKIDNNAGAALNMSTGYAELHNCVFENNGRDYYTNAYGTLHLVNCTVPTPDNTGFFLGKVIETSIGGNPSLHRVATQGFVASTQDTMTHSPGYAWTIQFSSAHASSTSYNKFRIATVAVKASKLVTVKVWMYVEYLAGIVTGLHIPSNAILGLGESFSTMPSTVDEWVEVTLTFTPPSAGTVPIYIFGRGRTFPDLSVSRVVHVDDFSISQAD